ncbi:serine/threonine protein phosphatase [Trypanosoma theileri]|uniref:Serine/threonine protein phosphatase n=1 Tax=Trypanosoma theileri TaxID=67003 RepID=A0A1X0P2G6_9TRYP|nr:serine/threonine protein phosphatase [Trypanosoma theileri]ORC90729.1 serine/threonine protein phosphatase [Trypanosoma theileri]
MMSLSFLFIWTLFFCASEIYRCEGRRIVAVGDLHGDLNQTLSILRLTGIVDDRQHWIGGDTYFVQLGDILDVGPDDLSIVRLFMKLEKEAREKGGNVIQLLGNHEIRNLVGDYSAVDPSSLAHSGGKRGRDLLLSNQTALGMYLRTRKAIFHHNEFLFMHGGLSAETGNMITSIKKIEEFNDALRNALVNNTLTPLGKAGLNMAEDDEDKVANPILVRSILNVRCGELKNVLTKKFPGIKSVVVGHVPHDPEDFSDWRLCDGSLIAIDFGLSRWKKGDPGHVAALEIDDESGHVLLLESTVDFHEFKPDIHNTTVSDIRPSLPLIKLAGAVVGLIVILGLLAIWMLSGLRVKSFSGERHESYGSIDSSANV